MVILKITDSEWKAVRKRWIFGMHFNLIRNVFRSVSLWKWIIAINRFYFYFIKYGSLNQSKLLWNCFHLCYWMRINIKWFIKYNHISCIYKQKNIDKNKITMKMKHTGRTYIWITNGIWITTSHIKHRSRILLPKWFEWHR